MWKHVTKSKSLAAIAAAALVLTPATAFGQRGAPTEATEAESPEAVETA